MPSNGIQAKIEIAQKRAAAAQEALKKAQAAKRLIEQRQRARESKIERSKDARRKILIGATVLDGMRAGAMDSAAVKMMLDRYLSRDDDRALFGLAPRTVPVQPQEQKYEQRAA